MPAVPSSVRNISERAGEHGWHALVTFRGPHEIEAVYTLHAPRTGRIRQRYVALFRRQGSSWPMLYVDEVVWAGTGRECLRTVTKANLYAALRGE